LTDRVRVGLIATAAAAAAVATGGAVGAASGTGGQHVVGYVRPETAAHAVQTPSVPPGYTGGPITAATGETVTVYSSPTILAADPNANQRWADFIAALPHGAEISKVTVLISSAFELRRLCGFGALGCYDGNTDTLSAIGQDTRDVSAASVVTHEYGHHIANNRLNPPWDPIDYGTKRWASYINVCKRTEAGELAPGDEGAKYQENPGELLAETYRLLVERLHGLPESAWEIVDKNLYPDATALDLLQQDVLSPWTANTTSDYGGRFTKGSGIGRRYVIPTPDDGTFTASLSEQRGTEFDLRLVDPASRALLAASRTGPAPARTITFTVCGQRQLQVGITRVSGFGSYTLRISKP
jgi:hypothetical protein